MGKFLGKFLLLIYPGHLSTALNVAIRWIIKDEPGYQVGVHCKMPICQKGGGVGNLGMAALRRHIQYQCSNQTLGYEPLDVTCLPPTAECQLRRACS